MGPMTQYPMLQTLLSPFRRSQRKTLALVIAALTEVAQAASLAVAGHLAVQLGIQLGRAVTRVYRLLRHPRIDDQLLTAQLLWLRGQGRRLLIALDGTEGHHPLKRLLASVVVGCRAIPVQTAVFTTKDGVPRIWGKIPAFGCWSPPLRRWGKKRGSWATEAFPGSRGSSASWT